MENDPSTLVEAIIYACGGIYGYILGLNHEAFIILMILMVLDIAIGVIFSFINGEFTSEVMKKGLVIKIGLLLLVLSLALFQITLVEYGIDVPFSNSMAGVFTFMEMFSILETFADNNIILPKSIRKWFKKTYKELYEDEEE